MSKRRVARMPFALLLGSDREPRFSARGFIMLEVLAAVALVSVLLVTLTVSVERAAASARQVREVLAAASDSLSAGREVDAWSWGPRVLSGYWEAGPVLYLRIPQLGGRLPEYEVNEVFLGLWIDGWSVTQRTVEAGEPNTLRLDAPLWVGRGGKEVIVRLRAADHGWGPPWRTVVPCAAHEDTGQDGSGPWDDAAASAVIHPVNVSTLAPQAAVGCAPVAVTSQGPLWVFEGEVRGLWRTSLSGREQAWWGEEGRNLDVYY